MGDVGFGVIGLGMGEGRAKLVTQTEGARLVKVVDINTDLAARVGEELGCPWTANMKDILDDDEVEVVLVMTPSGMHGQMAIQVLEAGKHAVTTKPMEVTTSACDAMIAAADKADRLLGVDFQTRYKDTVQKIKYAVDHGLFGKPILGETRLKWYRKQAYYDAGGWRGTWKMDGGGALANQTIHGIDLLVWIMGQPKSVIGRVGCFTHQIETEDMGMAMIEFESGASGTILGTTTFPQSPLWSLEVHGSEGGVLADMTGEAEWFFLDGMEDRKQQLRRLNPIKNIIEDVVSALHRGTSLICDGRQGRRSIELLGAVYASARDHSRPIELG